MKSIMFFSHGNGWGHAIRDMIIIDALREQLPGVRLALFSYDQGYEAFSFYDRECVNIRPPEWPQDGPEWGKKLDELMNEYMTQFPPDLIISDEVGLAVSIAMNVGVPCIFISDWLPIKPHVSDQGFRTVYSADRIVYLGYEGSMHPPEDMRHKVDFVGPVIRKSECTQKDRSRIRNELRMDTKTRFILVLAGGVQETDEDYFRVCIDGFRRADIDGRLYLVCGRLFERFQRETDENIEVVGHVKDPNRLVLASNLIISRGGHTTMWEIASMTTPSIIIPASESANVIQKIHANDMEHQRFVTRVISESDLSEETLSAAIERILDSEEEERTRIRSALDKYGVDSSEDKVRDIILSML